METQITASMKNFLGEHPGLKFLFFGGKGGVGKTVMAGATALWLARQGKKTLLASTNPVHSLSGLLGMDVYGKITPLPGEDKAFAYEIDTKDTIDKSRREIKDKINWFLRFADLQIKADDFVEAATLNPAFEESAMFENMLDLMFGEEFEVYVFDTAPTANARRLLGMSRVYSLWVNKMMKSREEATSLRQLLSFSKKGGSRPPDGLPGEPAGAHGARPGALDRPRPHRLFLRDPPRGPAHRGDYPVSQLVPRFRHPGGGHCGQRPHPGLGDRDHAGIHCQPPGHAGGPHANHLAAVRRPGAGAYPPFRSGGPGIGGLGPLGRETFRLRGLAQETA
jgi:hypothetical protein